MTRRASVTVTCDLCFKTDTFGGSEQSHAAVGYWGRRLDDLPVGGRQTIDVCSVCLLCIERAFAMGWLPAIVASIEKSGIIVPARQEREGGSDGRHEGSVC